VLQEKKNRKRGKDGKKACWTRFEALNTGKVAKSKKTKKKTPHTNKKKKPTSLNGKRAEKEGEKKKKRKGQL